MSSSAASSRQSTSTQVLHSGLACTPQETSSNISEPLEGFRGVRQGGTSPYRVSTDTTSSPSPTPPRRRPVARRQPTVEEQHEEFMRNFQRRYKLDLVPSMCQFRLSTTAAGYRLSADVCRPRRKNAYVSLGIKLGEDPLIVKKVVLTPQHSDIRMFTPAMEFGILQLQFAVGYDWSKRTFGASWRCKTKWTRGSRLQKRVRLLTKNNFEVASFWNVRSELPTMGGQFGSRSSSIQADIGRLQLDLDRLKVSAKW